MEFYAASTTSLFMIMLASLAATLVFGRKKTVDWKLLFSIVPLAILGSFAGGYVAQFVSVLTLKIIFAAVLIIAAFFMLRPAKEGQSPSFMPQWCAGIEAVESSSTGFPWDCSFRPWEWLALLPV